MKTLLSCLFLFSILLLSSCYTDSGGNLTTSSSNNNPNSTDDFEIDLQLDLGFNWRYASEISKVLIPNENDIISFNSSTSSIQKRNIITGEVAWTWNNSSLSSNNHPTTENSYFNNDLMLFNIGQNYFCINSNSGETVWENEVQSNFVASCDQAIFGIDEHYFQIRSVKIDNIERDVIYQGNINNSDSTQYLTQPNYQDSIHNGSIGRIGSIQPFKNDHGDICLAISYSEPTNNSLIKNNFISVWNIENSTWEYEKIFVMDARKAANLKKIDTYLYCYTGNKISCLHLDTGELVWKNDFIGNYPQIEFSDSHIIIDLNLNYITTLQILDSKTGELQWDNTGLSVYNMKISSRYAYLHSDYDIKILDIFDGSLVKTIDHPYTEYPAPLFYVEYFKSGIDLVIWEDESTATDYVSISTNKYIFGMELSQ